MALLTIETDASVDLANRKQKLLDAGPLLDSFDVSQVLEADARLYAVMVERQCFERAVRALAPTPSWRLVYENALEQMVARQLGYQPKSSSVISNEVELRRHFELTHRISTLRDAIAYGDDEAWG